MKIGVIGAGWWGKNIINTCENIDEISSVVYFDSNPEVQDKFFKNKKSIFCKTFDTILYDDKVNAVCIATPPATHYYLTEMALKSGKHVMIEKPPAFSPQEVETLGSIAFKKSLVYMLDALFLFMKPIQGLKKIIDSGILTDIRHIDMYRIGDELRREGAGIQRIKSTMFDNNTDVVEDLFFHDAGILLNLFNSLQVKSVQKFFFYDERLCDTAKIDFRSGQIPLTLTLSWALTGRRRGMTIYDKNFIVEYDGLVQEKQIIVYNLLKNTKEDLTFENTPPLQNMIEYFISCINHKTSNVIDHSFMKTIIKCWEDIRNAS